MDVDSLSLSEIGGWPWNRMYFSRVAAAVLNAGKARAVGFDFVFSDLGVSESADESRLHVALGPTQERASFGGRKS